MLKEIYKLGELTINNRIKDEERILNRRQQNKKRNSWTQMEGDSRSTEII